MSATRFTNLAPIDLDLLRSAGVPDDAIDDEAGTLDVDLLLERGWLLDEGGLRCPPGQEPDEATIARRREVWLARWR